MIQILSSAWALFLGLMLLMVGNGLQGTLLGVRGDIEGFSTFEMSVIMSAYFVGFLGGSSATPEMIRRVGHVRVFAALGSLISAVLILYPALANPAAWALGRVMMGFCFAGVYVTAESWINNAADNENRGKALSLYMIVQTAGIVSAQGLLLVADPSGYILFVISSVLVSISFAPILLSITPTPTFDTAKPLSIKELVGISPLGCAGMFLLGGVFAAQFGMAAVYGGQAGLSLPQISIFVAAFYVGAVLLQYPLGWLSDRMDRRLLILAVALIGGVGAILGTMTGGSFELLLVSAFLIGAMVNPLYSLLVAYTNDFLDPDDMAAASGGLVFINGVGAIMGPLITGWLMSLIGPEGYFVIIAALLLALAGYALYRMTQRSAIPAEDMTAYTPVMASATPVAVEFAREYAIDSANEEETDQNASN